MRLRSLANGVILLLLLLFLPFPARAQGEIHLTKTNVEIAFPERITFRASLESSAEINALILEYRVEQLTCAELVAEAFPDFTPGKKVDAAWTWEMRQSGSLPAGATIEYRWRVKDSAGNSLVSEFHTITWLDEATHDWQSQTQGGIRLHWYEGDKAYVNTLLDAAVTSLATIEEMIGLKTDGLIDLYIYPSSKALTDSVYFIPEWTGGLAYPENNIILIGIEPSQMEWGVHAVTHELTHVVVDRFAFGCLAYLPTWLNEGLAKYTEGEWDADAQKQLEEAIASDTIFSVRALASSFPEDSDRANLAYTQSQNLVSYLVKTHGPEKMVELLEQIREGSAIDPALEVVYGFNQEGLEDAWRAAVNAAPRSKVLAPTATPLPTPVPTIVPISGVPLVITPGAPPDPAGEAAPPLVSPAAQAEDGRSLPMIILASCLCGFGLFAILIIGLIAFLIRRQRREG